MSSKHIQKKIDLIFGAIGTGGRDFARANKDLQTTHYDGWGINANTLQRVIFRGIYDRTSYLYLNNSNFDLPPIAIEKSLQEHLPSNPEFRREFVKWFYLSLEEGRKLPIPETCKRILLKEACDQPSDLPDDSKSFLDALEAKYCPPQSKRPLCKRKKRGTFLESDDEDGVVAIEPPKPQNKAKKEKHKRKHITVSDEEDIDPNKNLTGFVVPNDFVEFERK